MGKRKYPDINIGDVFDRLIVVKFEYTKNRRKYWRCKCICENETVVSDSLLKNGKTKSCGCLNKDLIVERGMKIFKESFEEWCIKNNLKYYLELWDYQLNTHKPSDVASRSNQQYYFKCQEGKHNSELKYLYVLVANYEKHRTPIKCDTCNSFAQWGINNLGEDFLEKYWDYKKNTVDPWKIPKAYNGYVWINCKEKEYHGSYKTWCNNFIKGSRCGYCKGTYKVHKLDSLGYLYPEVLEIWSNKNKKSPYEYTIQSNQYVFWRCKDNKHEEYKRAVAQSVNAEFRCPECMRGHNSSELQKKVSKYIKEKYKLEVLHEGKCTLVPRNPKNNRILPFDNDVIIGNSNLIIEVNGVAHYRPDGLTARGARKRNVTLEEQFHKRLLYDRYKRFVAFKQGYFYIEIPYWTEQDESYKKLIDKKIQEILNINLEKSA